MLSTRVDKKKPQNKYEFCPKLVQVYTHVKKKWKKKKTCSGRKTYLFVVYVMLS